MKFTRTAQRILFTACLAYGAAAPAADVPADASPREGPVAIDPAEARVGELIAAAAFTDLDGKPGSLADARDAKATVICMTGVGCPVARKILPTLARLEQSYRDRGVRFVLVNPNAHEPAAEVRAAAAGAAFGGRTVHDPEARVARALGATSSTEVFVLDAARTLQYRGAADDQYGLGYALPAPRRQYLAEAIDAVLASRRPETPATTAPGCALDLKPAVDAAADTGPAAGDVAAGDVAAGATPGVTYHNRVSRIVRTIVWTATAPARPGRSRSAPPPT